MNFHPGMLLATLALGLPLVSASCAQRSPTEATTGRRPPNIVLIVADDLGVETLGSHGGTSYRTPNLDRLAAEGLRFTHAYAQPLCTNTRTQLMTGLANDRNWLAFGLLDPRSKTIGHYLQETGHRTAMAGKWQLTSYDPPDYPGAESRRGRGMHPADAGFEEYSLFHSLHTEDKGSRYADPTFLENGVLRGPLEGRYGPDLWVEYLNDFMTRHRDEPFFVYYPMALPHWPMVPTPRSEEWKEPSRRHEEDTRYFADMVEYLDQLVGRIVGRVDELGLAEDTYVIFYSDNGTHLSITSQTRDGPVAGGKGLTTDAGTHVPLIIRRPGSVKPGVCEDLVDSTDFLPTLRELAGRPLSPEIARELDGVSFAPCLEGKPSARETVYCYYDPRPGWDKEQFTRQVFVRDRRFKLYEDGRLLDVGRDPLELAPISASSADPAAREARARLARELEAMRTRPLAWSEREPTPGVAHTNAVSDGTEGATRR